MARPVKLALSDEARSNRGLSADGLYVPVPTDVEVHMADSPAAALAPTAGVREWLAELRTVADELLPPDSLADLDDAVARLDGARCNVAVLGEFKRGKSTLVNALIEHAVLPTDVLPLTSAITVVRHGPRPRLVVGYADGAEQERPFSELRALVADSGDAVAGNDVVSVAVEVPDALLARGMQIVDTPGIGSIHAHNTTTTERFLGRVDIALCVLAADQPLNAPERELIATVTGEGARPLFAVNKIDQIDGGDLPRTLEFVANGLRGVAADAEMHPVSARTGEGVSALRERLIAIANSELGDVIARSARARGARIARNASQAARLETAALRLPLDELEERARELEQRLTELEHAREDARDLLARGVERALRERVDEPLTRRARDERAALEDQLDRVATGHESTRELARQLDAWIDQHTREEFAALAPRYAHEIGEELRMLESRYSARATEILDAVRMAAQAGLDTDLTTAPAPSGLRRPPAFTFKLEDPEGAVARLVAASRVLLPGPLGRSLVRRAARERLLAMTDRHAGRLRAALGERVRETTNDYVAELDATVDAAITAIRAAVDRARRSHANQRQPTELRLRDLAGIELRCRELAAELEQAG
jgi:small GTP-binding protein